MTAMEALPLAGLLGLGALHGINPGMGWLFAVAKGLQERRRRAVWRAVVPLAVGHALGIGVTVAVAVMLALCAWAAEVPTRVSASRARESLEAVFMVCGSFVKETAVGLHAA